MKTLFTGLIFFYTIILIVAAILFLALAAREFYHHQYLEALLGIAMSAGSFGMITLTTRYLIKEEEGEGPSHRWHFYH